MALTSKQIYSRLLKYSRPYAGRIALALAASLVVAGTDVASAKLVQPFIDLIIADRNAALAALVPVFVIGLAALKGGARYVQEYFIKTAGQLVVQDVRNDLYRHSLSLSMGFFSKNSSGGLMSRVLNDVGIMQRSAADILVEAVREGFTLVGLTGLAFYTDWRLACLAFVILPVAVVPASVIGRKIKDNTRKGQSTMGNLTAVLQETFSGIKVIKAFGTERAEDRRFRDENLSFYRYMRKVLKYDSASAPVIELLASFGVAAVVWYGIHRVISGAMTQGELFSFVASVLMMYGPVKKLTKVSNTVQKSVGAAERVFEVMDEVPEVADAPDAVEVSSVRGEVAFDRVSFSYGDEAVVRDFSIVASPGEVVALVGPSGAGKSTVAGLLARFYDPIAGAIRIDGVDLRRFTLDSLRSHIALVDQETFLFNTSIAENIRYGKPEATDEEILEAARKAFADDFINALPEGFRTSIGDRGLRLSGGQRQRLCIARAILRDAPVLILDEATSALDTESETMVQKALANLMKNRTTFVIAHRLSTIMHADKIVVMEQGAIREIGTHRELLEAGGLYRKLYDMQFEG
ncbi:lipid A export permease/ATP-binding protein MsbA [Desulfuromonas versatilis]|uniref:Lipid A export permease/ATP-binding protein MsbA n=1 Tax=Desulfuromonas versatilis TaxID=2802975 RepID=A0ABN6DYI5_9BACT|nr:lipid A export permease/ATP-binding protein MsbA [Desulfuromonas versatilis]BCR05203.1 lipid A export permease/ATP-binding protein MsbA [Desulfuromonas versatilis]